MPNGKKKQGHNRLTGGESAVEGLQGRMAEAGGAIRETAGQVGDRVREGYATARASMAHQYQRVEGIMARNPASSIVLGFGLGFGLGVLLAMALTEPEETWFERRLRKPLRHLPDRLRDLHLPESIARHLPSH
jgi:hypothetical protein